MAIQNKNTLKSWFLRGSKPLAAQYADWMDSFWHKDENIPASKIENLQSLLDGKANSNVIEQIKNSVETLSAHPSDNIRHVTQQDKEYWNGKADVTVKGSWKTAASHAHYFASSAINKYAVGKYIPLIRIVSNNMGKMDCYFDIISREFGEYQSYFGRFMFTGRSETAKLTCLDYFDNGLGKMLSADDICFKLEGNIATIYRKISNTPESPANTDYFIVSVWGENTSTYSTQNYYTTAGILEPNELQLLEAVDVTGATVAVLANDYGSVEMASSTADVLKEKTLYFIPNNNAYDGYVRHISNITTTQIEHTAHLAESGAPYYREVQKLGTYIYAVGDVQDGGTINRYAELLRSSDYGATWESTLVPLNREIGFYILNNLLIVKGVDSDNNSHLYTSSDYGDTWGEKQMPSNSSIHPIEYYNGNYYCIINGNVICKSPDLVTWESSTLPANPSSWGMAVFKGLLIAMSCGNYCCWTEDGVTWHTETFEVQSGGFGLWGFVTDGNIIICKSYYCWLTSYDGKHWTAHNPNNPAPGTTEPFLSAVLHDGKKWIVKKAFIQDAQEPSYVAKWFVGIDFDNLEEVISFPPRSAVNYNQLISVGNKILAIDSDSVSVVDFNTSKIFEVNITYFEKVIEGASLKNHIDNKVMHLNTITIPTGNNGTAKCFKIMSIDDCSNFSNFTLLSNYVNDIGMVSNMSIDMIGIYDDSYGHKVFDHHVLGTPQVYCNKRTHMEEEQEILDGVDVYLYTTFFQNSNIVVTLLQGQNLLTDDITFGNLGTEELSNLQNVVSKKMDILPIDSVKGLQDKLNTLAAPRYSIVTQLPKMVDAVANHTYYVKEDGIMCGYLKKNASWVEGEPQDHIVSQNGGEWQSIVYGKGVYVAIRNSEAIGYSYDGIAWYRAHILPGSSFYTIAYGNGMFVTCSTSEYVAYSYDGINWFYSDSNTGDTPIDSPQIVKFFNDRFFIVSGAVLDKVAYSLDGITWTQVTLPSARWWADAAFGNGTYVVIYHGGDLAYSSDLVNWTEIQLPSTHVDWIHVDFVPWLGKFIATAKVANFIAISSDGITWEQVSLPITTNLDWSKVVYNDYKIIMKANQSTKGLMSENGTSWTEFNVPSAMEYRDLAYGKGKFVIMGGTTVLQPVYLEEYVCISNS